MKHTPGPWKFYDNTQADDSFRIMHLDPARAPFDVAKVRLEADARLIAVSPYILELLEETLYNASMPESLRRDIEAVLARIHGAGK